MDELIKILTEMTEALTEILPLEQEKFRAVQEDKVGILDGCMGREQAFALRIKGLEQKRMKFMEEHGYGGMTLKELADRLEGEEQGKMRKLLEDLVLAVQNFNSYNDESMKLINLKLHNLERAAAPDGGLIYGRDKAGDEEDMISRRV